MIAKRVLVAQVLDRLGAVEAVLRLLSRVGAPWLTVLTYHHVHERNGGYPFDPDVIDVLPGEFDRQLATLQRYF